VFAYLLAAGAAPSIASAAAPAAPPVAPVVAPAPTAPAGPDAGSGSLEGAEPSIVELDPGLPRGAARSSAEDARAALPVDAARPVWGSKQALVTLVMFGDLECVHTRRAFAALGRLKQKLGDELRIVWRHRPLDIHEHARSAALYAAQLHASRGDEAFFRLVMQLSRGTAAPTARELELSTPSPGEPPTLDAARAAKLAAERLAQDLVLAGQLRVRATPTLFINGIRVDGYASYDELQRLVERELVGARATLASGVSQRELYARRTLKNLVNVGAP
jgi:protein-disulfide isomerase